MSHKVLIVEDSATMRQLIGFALKRIQGVEITEAQDGMDGLKKISSDKYDLALIDINMPLLDGLKLVKLIRSDPRCKDIPIAIDPTEAPGGPGAGAAARGQRVPHCRSSRWTWCASRGPSSGIG
jgi:two-component system chemotaxis response regulator CheY